MEQPEKKPVVIQGELFPLETPMAAVQTEDQKESVKPTSVLSTLTKEELDLLDEKDPEDYKNGQY